jgi:hypothetical protein
LTVIYERDVPGPKTHAFVIGCGRFPGLDGALAQRLPQTVAGAHAFIQFLEREADNFIAPLATIEVLLSDPAFQAGQDRFARAGRAHDRRADDQVDSATRENARTAGNRWRDQCQPGDHMIFYMASHGVADGEARAMGVLEDINTSPHQRWHETVNVASLARGLPQLDPGAGWIFLDACQTLYPEVLQYVEGVASLSWITVDVVALASRPKNAVALGGSRYGEAAWAPAQGAPYFTQALLHGLEGACVQAEEHLGWAVNSRPLLWDLHKVADAALDWRHLHPEMLAPCNLELSLLKVAQPMVPVAVRTNPQADLAHAVSVVAAAADGRSHVRDDQALTWRFRVQPDGVHYTVTATFPPGGPLYASNTFPAYPPARVVTLGS